MWSIVLQLHGWTLKTVVALVQLQSWQWRTDRPPRSPVLLRCHLASWDWGAPSCSHSPPDRPLPCSFDCLLLHVWYLKVSAQHALQGWQWCSLSEWWRALLQAEKKAHIPLSAQVKSAASPNNHPSRRLAFRVLWFNPNQRTFSLGVDLLDMTLRIKFFLKLAFYAHKRVICVHKMIFFGCKLVICLHKLAFLGTKWQ